MVLPLVDKYIRIDYIGKKGAVSLLKYAYNIFVSGSIKSGYALAATGSQQNSAQALLALDAVAEAIIHFPAEF